MRGLIAIGIFVSRIGGVEWFGSRDRGMNHRQNTMVSGIAGLRNLNQHAQLGLTVGLNPWGDQDFVTSHRRLRRACFDLEPN